MRFYTVTFKIILMLVFVAGAQSSKLFHCAQHDSDSQKKFANPGFERLFTVAIAEPAGYTAACFATNIDSLSRIIVAEIFDWRGDNVTETSSCGVPQGSGITCQLTAQYRDSALRSVVSTSGEAINLRGSISTSSSPYPFTGPANSTIAAQ